MIDFFEDAEGDYDWDDDKQRKTLLMVAVVEMKMRMPILMARMGTMSVTWR